MLLYEEITRLRKSNSKIEIEVEVRKVQVRKERFSGIAENAGEPPDF